MNKRKAKKLKFKRRIEVLKAEAIKQMEIDFDKELSAGWKKFIRQNSKKI